MMQADQAAGELPGVTVVNNSWGVPEFGVDPAAGNYVDETYYGARFLDPGVKYVAASGDNRVVQFPAADPLVISVGGLVVSGKRSHVWAGTGRGWSQYYPGHYVPDVYAPMSEAFYQGTSVSTAIVSGLIADGLEP
jgi:subtilase family serine protease